MLSRQSEQVLAVVSVCRRASKSSGNFPRGVEREEMSVRTELALACCSQCVRRSADAQTRWPSDASERG